MRSHSIVRRSIPAAIAVTVAATLAISGCSSAPSGMVADQQEMESTQQAAPDGPEGKPSEAIESAASAGPDAAAPDEEMPGWMKEALGEDVPAVDVDISNTLDASELEPACIAAVDMVLNVRTLLESGAEVSDDRIADWFGPVDPYVGKLPAAMQQAIASWKADLSGAIGADQQAVIAMVLSDKYSLAHDTLTEHIRAMCPDQVAAKPRF